MTEATHYAFSDDSKHKEGRYCSLSLVTLEKRNFSFLNSKLEIILQDSDIKNEFKWKKLRNKKYKSVAEKIIDFVFENSNSIRIDILIWHLEDKRHKNVLRRDDEEDLVRMYYHLLSSTLSKKWPVQGSLWEWFPDKQSSVNWALLKECINNKKHNCISDLFGLNPGFEQVRVLNVKPSDSHEKKFIQIADLFAGIGIYSYVSFKRYKKWEQQNTSELNLFLEQTSNPKDDLSFTNSEKYRFQIIDYFNKKAKQHKLQISFERSKGFKSYNPRKFIDFWLYEPQSENDKAPQKKP